ncbi:sll0787 family AIR synthase-like protein [Pseudomonas gingeri]|uniref:sll0787 family AIR synthase-like protein n=3 Tax=Pseudomonas gingeri TaxID=117681 RepID=UPI0015A25DF6|nr:sll0787 family AIR synthase-like protein [Pseudomonas gingeri]NVZ66314.1 sll0787 family AIR synthase-like protein [Pseudomonas gingeri]
MTDPILASTALQAMLHRLRDTPAMRAKLAIQHPARALPARTAGHDDCYALPGDDTAAIRCGDQYQLLAIEGMIPAFVEQAPWFAGWSAVMANVSDITAMGGRASAVVNAYWHHDRQAADSVLTGIRDACQAYGLILAGGHTSQAPGNPAALAVAISGWARSLLSTLHVAPDQVIAMAVDLDGSWHGTAPYWKAFENVPAERLREKLEVIPRLAEAGLLHAAKDISNAGILGTLLMLLEPTTRGARIDLDALPRPADAPLERWLQAFPSYGFLLTLERQDLPTVEAAFAFEGIHCACIGEVDDSARLRVGQGDACHEFWNLAEQPFTGFSHPGFQLSAVSKEH